MGKLKWYRRDPNAALAGMHNLSLEERGAYNTVLDLLYARDGDLDDDERFIAGHLRCDVRVWRRIRSRLLDLGKLWVDEAGKLRNRRVDEEVDRALLRAGSAADAGRASGQARKRKSGPASNGGNGLAETDAPTPAATSVELTRIQNQERDSESLPKDSSSSPPARAAAAEAQPPPAEQVPRELVTEVLRRVEVLGRTLAQVEGDIANLVELAGSAAMAKHALRKGLSRSRGDPLAYAFAVAKGHAVQLAAACHAAERPPPEAPDPWATAIRENRERDQRHADVTPAHRSLSHEASLSWPPATSGGQLN